MIRNLALSIALLFPSALIAQIVPDSVDDVVELRLLPGWRGEDGVHVAAFHFKLAPGWRTYWRAPGDGGIPTRISWLTSHNVDHVDLHWPTPEVFRTYGQRSVGYRDELILPFSVTPKTQGDITFSTTVRFGVCEEICLPVQLNLTTVLPPEGDYGKAPIKAALQEMAVPAQEAGVHSVDCRLVTEEDGYKIAVSMYAPLPTQTEALVIEAQDPRIWISEPVLKRDGMHLQAEAMVSRPVDASQLRLTLISRVSAIDIRSCN